MNANTTLIDLSNNLADAVERAGRSTVTVNGRRRMPATGIVWSDDGIIVTANHVVERDEDIHIGLPDGVEVEAELVGRDPSTDIAMLRVRASGLTPAPNSSTPVRAGHLALAIGKPGDNAQQAALARRHHSHDSHYLGEPGNNAPLVTLGVVSAVGETLRTRRGGSIDDPVYADLTLYPGFSGGPLVNAAGEIIGMNSSGLSRGLSVTIPHAVIDHIGESLRQHGRITHGYIGVALQPVELPATITRRIDTRQEGGMLITGIEPDSPADSAGLMLGDILLTFGGQPVDQVGTLQGLLTTGSTDMTQDVQIVRGGELRQLSITVGSR